MCGFFTSHLTHTHWLSPISELFSIRDSNLKLYLPNNDSRIYHHLPCRTSGTFHSPASSLYRHSWVYHHLPCHASGTFQPLHRSNHYNRFIITYLVMLLARFNRFIAPIITVGWTITQMVLLDAHDFLPLVFFFVPIGTRQDTGVEALEIYTTIV